MNINASAWPASKDFIPPAGGMPPFANNGGSSFNTQANTFTPQSFGGMPSYAAPFNQNAQSFNPPGSFQSQQPLPPGPTQPAPSTQMNAGMKNFYGDQARWQPPMHQQAAGGHPNFTPSNVGAQPFAPSYAQYPPSNYMQGQMGGGQYYQQTYSMPPLYNQTGGQPNQYKKPYNKGGNSQNYNNNGPNAQSQFKPKNQQYHGKRSYSGFEAPGDFNPNMSQYKQKNIEL